MIERRSPSEETVPYGDDRRVQPYEGVDMDAVRAAADEHPATIEARTVWVSEERSRLNVVVADSTPEFRLAELGGGCPRDRRPYRRGDAPHRSHKPAGSHADFSLVQSRFFISSNQRFRLLLWNRSTRQIARSSHQPPSDRSRLSPISRPLRFRLRSIRAVRLLEQVAQRRSQNHSGSYIRRISSTPA